MNNNHLITCSKCGNSILDRIGVRIISNIVFDEFECVSCKNHIFLEKKCENCNEILTNPLVKQTKKVYIQYRRGAKYGLWNETSRTSGVLR